MILLPTLLFPLEETIVLFTGALVVLAAVEGARRLKARGRALAEQLGKRSARQSG